MVILLGCPESSCRLAEYFLMFKRKKFGKENLLSSHSAFQSSIYYDLMIFNSDNCARKNKILKNSEQFWKIEWEQISFFSTYITSLIQEIEKCSIKRIVRYYIGNYSSIIWLYFKKNKTVLKGNSRPIFCSYYKRNNVLFKCFYYFICLLYDGKIKTKFGFD